MTCPRSSICRSGRPLALEGPRRSQEWALPVGQGICSPGLQGTEPSRRGPSQPCNWETQRCGWPVVQSTSWKRGFQEAPGSPAAPLARPVSAGCPRGAEAGLPPRPPLSAADGHRARPGSPDHKLRPRHSLWQRGHAPPPSRFGLAHTMCHPDCEKPQEGRKLGARQRGRKKTRGLRVFGASQGFCH